MRQAVLRLAQGAIYGLGTWLLTLVVKLAFGARFLGREHIPPQGAIVIARHRSYWDVPLIIAAFRWSRRVWFVARRTLMEDHPLLRPFIRGFALPIDRERFRKEDFRKVMAALEADKLVGIFPEGTIRASERVYPGVIHFAARSGREFVPVGLRARRGRYPPRSWWRRPALDVVIGPPFSLRDLEFDLSGSETRSQRMKRLSELLMGRIDRLEGEQGFEAFGAERYDRDPRGKEAAIPRTGQRKQQGPGGDTARGRSKPGKSSK